MQLILNIVCCACMCLCVYLIQIFVSFSPFQIQIDNMHLLYINNFTYLRLPLWSQQIELVLFFFYFHLENEATVLYTHFQNRMGGLFVQYLYGYTEHSHPHPYVYSIYVYMFLHVPNRFSKTHTRMMDEKKKKLGKLFMMFKHLVRMFI